jgi:hypothetical protein
MIHYHIETASLPLLIQGFIFNPRIAPFMLPERPPQTLPIFDGQWADLELCSESEVS